jgi:hypothetical protein
MTPESERAVKGKHGAWKASTARSYPPMTQRATGELKLFLKKRWLAQKQAARRASRRRAGTTTTKTDQPPERLTNNET